MSDFREYPKWVKVAGEMVLVACAEDDPKPKKRGKKKEKADD